MSIPVVIVENGLGFPVRPVSVDAPTMVVSENKMGVPIVISDLGAPFIIDGYNPEPPIIQQPFTMLAGTVGEEVTGYYPPSAGSISGEPLSEFPVIVIYSNGSLVQILLSGDCEIYLQGTTPIFSGFDLGDKVGDWEYNPGAGGTVCLFTTTDVFVDGSSYNVTWVRDS